MTTNAITEKQDERVSDRTRPGGNTAGRDAAPSFLRDDEPTVPRAFGLVGGTAALVGAMALAFHIVYESARISLPWSIFLLAVGLCGLLFNAAFDRDVQVRRGFMSLGYSILVACFIFAFIPYPNKVGDLYRYAVPCALMALLFFLAFLRHETDPFLRDVVQKSIGIIGALLALVGMFGGNLRPDFLIVASLIGLLYLIAFVSSRGISNDLAYYAAIGISCVGALMMMIVGGYSLTPQGSLFFVTFGMILLMIGFMYLISGLVLAFDWPILVLVRRELGAYFLSPIAYLTMLGFAFFSWLSFLFFVDSISDPQRPSIEPIVRQYIVALFPVLTVVFVVPILTMRLLSEEQRTGTMEVLLTAPVDEGTIVLSKFFAALVTYLVVWLPFGLFLLAIPLAGGDSFDYRPLLSFLIALVVTGSAFMSMGLFFSSLTSNQIASGVLTFAGMLALTYVWWPAHTPGTSEAWQAVLTHISYLDLWNSTLEGKIVPRYLLFPLSLTVLFLFLTVKVLESRKWR